MLRIKFNKSFGNTKIGFDISCVLLSIILSLIFFHFSIVGIREGTIISAICAGIVVKFFQRHLSGPIENTLTKPNVKA